jgi:hypothetical protein
MTDIGYEEDGYRFNGGDAGDDANWSPIPNYSAPQYQTVTPDASRPGQGFVGDPSDDANWFSFLTDPESGMGYMGDPSEEMNWFNLGDPYQAPMGGALGGMDQPRAKMDPNTAMLTAQSKQLARYMAFQEKQLLQNRQLQEAALRQGNEHFYANLKMQEKALEIEKKNTERQMALAEQNAYAQHTGYFYTLPGQPTPPTPNSGLAGGLAAYGAKK